MFERFSDSSRRVIVMAREEARLLDHDYMGTEHLLLGLLSEGRGAAGQTLRSRGVSLEGVRTEVEARAGRGGSAPGGHVPFTDRAKRVLESSFDEAASLGSHRVETEHLLLGIIGQGEGVAIEILAKAGCDPVELGKEVIARSAKP